MNGRRDGLGVGGCRWRTVTRSVASWHDKRPAAGEWGADAAPASKAATCQVDRHSSWTRHAISIRHPQGNLRGSDAALPGVLHSIGAEDRRSAGVFCARCSLFRILAVRCLIRLSRLTAKLLALRAEPSPGKRRHSPPPPETTCGPIRLWAPDSAALPPPPKRAEPQTSWLQRTLLRVQRASDG